MTEAGDVVVVGGGVAGAAAAWALARRGRDVVLLEQHGFGHDRGSSHGGARIFRFAYPDRFYVDLARRSLAGWRALDARVAVVAAGAWVAPLVGTLVALPPLRVTEEQVFHFAPRDEATSWPSFIHYRPQLAAYGMLTPGEGVKVGEHHAGRVIADG